MTRRAVLFDLDGTLVDSAPSLAAALSQIRVSRGAGAVSAEQVRPWISLGALELARLGLGQAAGNPTTDVTAMRDALRRLPTPESCLYLGVRQLLERLDETGFRLGVVTNKPEALARKLIEDLALGRFFGTIVGGDSASEPKPHPAPILSALEALSVRPVNAVLVGDSSVDAQAASRASLPFYLFEGGYGARDCEDLPVAVRFASHSDLLPLLLGCERRAAA